MKSFFSFEKGAFSLLNEKGLGWRSFLFEFNGSLSSSAEWAVEESNGVLTASASFPAHVETLRFAHDSASGSLTVSRSITNNGKQPLCFKSVGDGLLGPDSALLVSPKIPGRFNTYEESNNLRWFHTGNLRFEHLPHALRLDWPYLRKLPIDAGTRFNTGEANDIPAFGVCDDLYDCVLVEGDLKQESFLRSWEMAVRIPSRRLETKAPGVFRGVMSSPGSFGFELAAGASVEVSKVFYQILEKTHPENAMNGYIDALGKEFKPRGASSPLLDKAVYCTWNFGVFGDINEASVLERARILKEKLPECEYFMIDDGYQAHGNGVDSFYPEPSKNFNPERFPHGMKHVADELKKIGLVPCLWSCPHVKRDSLLAKEKPEWLLRDVEGSTDAVFGGAYLDLGNPEARAFFLKILDTMYLEWGFKGVKFDFSSHWYLKDDARFIRGSGLDWREFVFKEIRKRVGDDGVFMTCLAAGMGNPLQGRHADSYRCSWDINTCTWPEIAYNAQAALPQILQEGRKSLLLNMDSVGFIDEMPENHLFFRFNWVFITQGLVELGGKVELFTERQFALLKKLMKNLDRGRKVHCPDEQAFRGEPLPEVLYVDYPEDSATFRSGVKRHVAFFNWSERRKVLGMESAGGEVEDFWTGEKAKVEDGMLSVVLPARSSALFSVKA